MLVTHSNIEQPSADDASGSLRSDLENETNSEGAKERRSRLARTVKVNQEVWRQFNRSGQLGAPVDLHSVFFIQRSVDWFAVKVTNADPVVLVVTDARKGEAGSDRLSQTGIESLERLVPTS